MQAEMKIVPPKGYCIDTEKSTFECIKFKPEKLTYEIIAYALFTNKEAYYIERNGDINSFIPDDFGINLEEAPNNCVSKEQCEKLLALNKLINVAKYLNGDWKPNYNDEAQTKYYIYLYGDEINIEGWSKSNFGIPCFKSEGLAKQAIEILGEETIKLALSQV